MISLKIVSSCNTIEAPRKKLIMNTKKVHESSLFGYSLTIPLIFLSSITPAITRHVLIAKFAHPFKT